MEKVFRTVPLALLLTFSVSVTSAQKPKRSQAGSAAPVIFAVINDGKTVEPIAFIENGGLVNHDNSDESAEIAKNYYKTGAKYNLIFGGVSNGTVTIKKSNVGIECGGSSADVSVSSGKAKLTGFVMALATNMPAKTKASGVRRMPTAAERAEIESLVRDEFHKNKVPASALKQLHYYNLTAIDADNDGTPEMIGSYWIAPARDRRDLLFFIAEKSPSGKYTLTHSEFSAVTPKDIMSGEPRDLDTMGGESFLDLFDYNGDGVGEIFSIEKAFEGNNYHVYARKGKQWTKIFDAYDYRCAY